MFLWKFKVSQFLQNVWLLLPPHFCKCGPHDLRFLVEFEYMCENCNHTRTFVFMEIFHRVICEECKSPYSVPIQENTDQK